MRAFKHYQSIVEESNSTGESWRWVHPRLRCPGPAISFGKNMTVYEEYLELIHAA
jgi:hypothetical protein